MRKGDKRKTKNTNKKRNLNQEGQLGVGEQLPCTDGHRKGAHWLVAAVTA